MILTVSGMFDLRIHQNDFIRERLFSFFLRSPTAKEQAVLQNFFDSEEIYVGALSVCLQYSKALTLSLSSSQPIISKEEINCIFFHIPQLYSLHSEFLQKFKATKLTDWNLIHVKCFITVNRCCLILFYFFIFDSSSIVNVVYYLDFINFILLSFCYNLCHSLLVFLIVLAY